MRKTTNTKSPFKKRRLKSKKRRVSHSTGKKPYREQPNPATVKIAKRREIYPEPNYAVGCGRMGGNLEDMFPQPHIRKFPNSVTKRKVVAEIHDYRGNAGGVHFYTSLREEDNPVWKGNVEPPYESEAHWVRPWGDDAGKGRSEHGRFDTYTEAVAWIDETVKTEFPDHELSREYLDYYTDEEESRKHKISTQAKISGYVKKGD